MKFRVEAKSLTSNKGNVFSFEDAGLSDLDQLDELEKICFTYDQINKAKFRAFILKDSSQLMVLKDKEKVIAYVLTLFRKNSKKCRIYSLCVHPDYSGQGLAGLVMGGKVDLLRSLEIFSSARLEVKITNHTAIKIYERLGFVYTKTIERFYSDGEDALIYHINLLN